MSTVPDFNYESTSADQIVSALKKHGCCVIRSIVPTEVLNEISQAAAQLYAEMDQRFEQEEMSEQEHRHCYRYGILRPFENDYRLESGQSMKERMLSCVLNTTLREAYEQFFQTNELNLLVPSSHLRRVSTKDAVPYHQDSSVMKLHTIQLINSWFPLDPAGIDAPSVEMIPEAQTQCWPSGLHNDGSSLYGHLEISKEQIAEKLNTPLWQPVLFPGDVLLLHSYTVHQTNAKEHMTKTRRDFELRFARRDELGERDDIKQLAVDF